MPQLHNPAKKKNLTATLSSLDRKNGFVISHLEGERILSLSRGKDYQKGIYSQASEQRRRKKIKNLQNC